MRATLIAVALIASACAPLRIVPSVGSRLDTHACYVTSSGVAVYREPSASCPDLAAMEARVRLVEERYGEVSGAAVYIVDAWVECAGDDVGGCTIGDTCTVTDGPTVLGTILHELGHVAINRRPGDNGLAHYDLDHRREWLNADKRARNPLGEDD